MIIIPEIMYQLITIIVLLFYLFFVIKGINEGFVSSFINLISSIVSLIFAVIFASKYAVYYDFIPLRISEIEYLNNSLRGPLNIFVWGIILFIIAKIVLLIASKIIAKIFELPFLKQMNGLLGGVLGLIQASIFIVIFTAFISLPMFKNGEDFVSQTILSKVSSTSNQLVSVLFTRYLDDITLENLVDNLKEEAYFKSDSEDVTRDPKEDSTDRVNVKNLIENELIAQEIKNNNLENYFSSDELKEIIDNNDYSSLLNTEEFRTILSKIKLSDLLNNRELFSIINNFKIEG